MHVGNIVFIKRALNRGHFYVDRSRGSRRIGKHWYVYLIHETDRYQNGWMLLQATAYVLLAGLNRDAYTS